MGIILPRLEWSTPGRKRPAHASGHPAQASDTACGNVSTRPVLAEFAGVAAARAIEPVNDVEVGGKKSVAPLKRPHRCFFGIVKPSPHAARIAKHG
jgi:hypothetical protein